MTFSVNLKRRRYGTFVYFFMTCRTSKAAKGMKHGAWIAFSISRPTNHVLVTWIDLTVSAAMFVFGIFFVVTVFQVRELLRSRLMMILKSQLGQ